MLQLKTGAIPAAGRLAKFFASSSLALSAIAGGLIVSGGEAKAATKCFDFSPVSNLVNPCVDGDWTNNSESFTAPNQTGLVDLTDVIVSPDQAQVDIDFDPPTQGGTSGSYLYNIQTDDHNIIKVEFTGDDGALGAVWTATKSIYSNSGRTSLVEVLSISNLNTSATSTVPFNLKQLWITDEWTTNTVGIDSLINIYQTPGPLPVLGAGAAFGFSRKLRLRVKASLSA